MKGSFDCIRCGHKLYGDFAICFGCGLAVARPKNATAAFSKLTRLAPRRPSSARRAAPTPAMIAR